MTAPTRPVLRYHGDNNEIITFGSVCSGIEAASVAWHPLGWRAAWLAEIEPFPCAVLAHHYPDVPNLGNMLLIPALLRNGTIPPPDVFTGGTPCQAFSVAGLRNSLGDARGNLSLTFCEIANEIDIQRAANGLLPCIIKWENVPGVLSTKDNAFGCFLAGLAGEDDPLVAPGGKWSNAGCVFGPQRVVAWRTLDAQFFGLAQRRRRVFVVASARKGFDPCAILFEPESLHRNSAPSRQAGQDVTDPVAESAGSGGVDTRRQAIGRATAQAFGGGKNCNPTDVGTALTAHPGGRYDLDVETFVVQPALSVALRGRDGGATAELGGDVAGTLRASGGGDKAHVLAPIAFSCKDHGADATSDLTPTMRAMNHSGSHANAGGQLAVVVHGTQDPCVGDIAFALGRNSGQENSVCITGDITHTLKAEGFDASEDGTGRGQPIVAAFAENSRHELRYEGGDGSRIGTMSTGGGKPGQGTPTVQVGMAVRRLTPKECARLQGFPDNYLSQVMVRGKPAADGPMYKAFGNSWAVPNVFWIGSRIDKALRKLR